MKVVVFHWRPKSPTYATPLMTLHNVKLESSFLQQQQLQRMLCFLPLQLLSEIFASPSTFPPIVTGKQIGRAHV